MSKECNRVTTIDYNLQTILSKEDSGLGAGGVGYPPYISHTGMCLPQPHRVGFLGRFGLKTGNITYMFIQTHNDHMNLKRRV